MDNDTPPAKRQRTDAADDAKPQKRELPKEIIVGRQVRKFQGGSSLLIQPEAFISVAIAVLDNIINPRNSQEEDFIPLEAVDANTSAQPTVPITGIAVDALAALQLSCEEFLTERFMLANNLIHYRGQHVLGGKDIKLVGEVIENEALHWRRVLNPNTTPVFSAGWSHITSDDDEAEEIEPTQVTADQEVEEEDSDIDLEGDGWKAVPGQQEQYPAELQSRGVIEIEAWANEHFANETNDEEE
eukprot:c22894_g1_i1.p1 GENE.c22894_g1_i1~~c22894_g1_i1.p1  ORF type:complete len:255 (+),score=68.25 c22894_g1_i1:37-765(+)